MMGIVIQVLYFPRRDDIYLKRELVPGGTGGYAVALAVLLEEPERSRGIMAHAAAMPCFMGESTARGGGEGGRSSYIGGS